MGLTESDWRKLSPSMFERLCSDLLVALGFQNVRSIGGAGDRGRDIVCEREFSYAPEFSDRFKWIIQCKHTFAGIDKGVIASDIAAALEHSPDVWWLMTTAAMTPNIHDFLEDRSHSQGVPFRIDYLDRLQLERLCLRFPVILQKYFAKASNAQESTAQAAMQLMNDRRYGDAVALLEASGYVEWPRSRYLLACCYAVGAGKRREAVEQAFVHLAAAMTGNYIEYMHLKFGWPRARCRREVYEDDELKILRMKGDARFRVIIGYTDEDALKGGCFPAGALVSTPEGDREIQDVNVKTTVTAVSTPRGSTVSDVVASHEHKSSMICVINNYFSATPAQPVYTADGWKRAALLRAGDLIVSVNGPITVDLVEVVPVVMKVYSLTLAGLPHYYVNGVLVHNAKK
jgi:hypothetical protein